MNTTELIRQWSMSGAHRDLAGRFRSSEDIRTAIATRASERRRTPERAPVLLKQADEDDWTPLYG